MGVEMIFIFLLALILFGPKRLPEMAREVGKFVAEFKRASNDFKYQLQAEIEKAGTESTPAQSSEAQQGQSFTQTILPPAALPDAVQPGSSAVEDEHERRMRTARMAFEAQSFTLRPPQAPTVPATESRQPPVPLPSATFESQASSSAGSEAASHSRTPDSAPAGSDVINSPAPQRS